jgi:hypothetical protein
VSNGDDDLKSINDTNTFSYSEQNNMTAKPCLGNNYNNDYGELVYPFSKRIQLKHEPKEAQENKPVHTNKGTKWKTLGGTFTTNYESLLDFNSQSSVLAKW